MSHKSVPAGNGMQWISSSFQMIGKNPGVFLLIALVLAILFAIPLLNLITQTILGPALMGGLMFAYREQENGREAKFEHLFAAFQIPGKIGPMLLLCLPGLAAGVLVMIVLFVTIGGALAAMFMGGGQPDMSLASFGVGALIGGLLSIAIGVLAVFCVYFATPRVMFDNVEPFAAIKESFAACLSNIGAILLVFVLVMLIAIVGMLLMIIPILGMIAWMLGILLLHVGINFSAYRDVFGDPNGAAENQLPPPPSPPAAPPAAPM